MNAPLRRVTVELIVRAATPERAKELAEARLNSWFLDPTHTVDDGPAPEGSLAHYRATPVGGHQGIVI